MPCMKTCVYNLAVGSDMAVNETLLAKEQDDTARMSMVEAAISRVLDAPPTTDTTYSQQRGCSTIVKGQADTTWTAPHDSDNYSNPLETHPVLCRDLVMERTDNTTSLDLADSNHAVTASTDLNPARSPDDAIPLNQKEINPSPFSSSVSQPTGTDTVLSVASGSGVYPGLQQWHSNPVWVGGANFSADSVVGPDGSTDLTDSDAEVGSSSHFFSDSDAGGDHTGNPSEGSEQLWRPPLDPVCCPATSGSSTCTDSEAGADDTDQSSEGSELWYPAVDRVLPPTSDSSTARTDSDEADEDTTDSGGSDQAWFPALNTVRSQQADAVSSPGQRTLEWGANWGGSVDDRSGIWTESYAEESGASAFSGGWDAGTGDGTDWGGVYEAWFQGLDTLLLPEPVQVWSTISDSTGSPPLDFGEVWEEEEGGVNEGVDGADSPLTCCSWVAKCFALPAWASRN